ncbi:hypothetical protein ACLOJK_000403 [Asimina triloba]
MLRKYISGKHNCKHTGTACQNQVQEKEQESYSSSAHVLGPWYPSVPSWEKRFCTSVCLIPWRKVCETQKMMQYCYQNIVEWDDSAGEEALKNAKERYWASINGLPCDLSLPDPDMYIDEVEWDCTIDPQLIADLEWQPSVTDVEDKDEKHDAWCHGWDDRPVPCTGWGDEPELTVIDNNNEGVGVCTGWGDEPESTVIDKNNKGGGVYDGWECSVNQPVVCTGWDDANGPVPPGKETVDPGWGNCDGNGATTTAWENKGCGEGHDNRWDSGGCESRHGNGNSWEKDCPNDSGGGWGHWESNPNLRNSDYHRNSGMPWGGTWNGNRKKRGGGGRWNGPRHSSGSGTRFQDDRQTNGGWNARGRKRCSFVHENPNPNPNINKRPLAPAQWHSMRSCGPVTHYGPAQASSTWRSWEKQVS